MPTNNNQVLNLMSATAWKKNHWQQWLLLPPRVLVLHMGVYPLGHRDILDSCMPMFAQNGL